MVGITVNAVEYCCNACDKVRSTAPIVQSSDAWAQVIANVAPLMALLGERNAKEYMRTASSWRQLLLLASAPLGILSITVSAIRLSGPSFLRRIVGRDSERRSEALVELTPLSVSPATSVYTPQAVEIAPTYERDRVAFVCGHVPTISDTSIAVVGFQDLLQFTAGPLQDDLDKEIVLTIWGSSLDLAEVADICDRVHSGDYKQSKAATLLPSRTGTASLGYRTTGVSPTQTSTRLKRSLGNFAHWRDLLVSFLFASFMIGIQILSLKYGTDDGRTFWMGVFGYLGIVIFTFGLLLMVQHEVIIEEKILPDQFKDAVWTFSDSRHAEHRPMRGPRSDGLVTARPRQHSTREKLRQHTLTSCLSLGVVGSYVVYYLSMRVSEWWVPLASLAAIWAGGLYRAFTARNFLVSTGDDVGISEHWIGLFRNTVSESLIATLEGAGSRTTTAVERSSANSVPPLTRDKDETGSLFDENIKGQVNVTTTELLPNRTVLLIVPAIRTGMRSWSGTEDVMKVGLEMAKHICTKRMVNLRSERLQASHTRWICVVRIRLAVYVPGLVWQSRHELDMALTREFDLESLIRHVMKMLHVCMDHEGQVTMHSVDKATSTALSHVLCGPIADPPIESRFDAETATLRQILTGLKENSANATTAKFSLEQATLLPTIILACTYNRWLHGSGISGDEIQALQNKHVDNLALSGKLFLPTIIGEFDRLGIWNVFMTEEQLSAERMDAILPRDATSGNYSTHNVKDQLRDSYVRPLGGEARNLRGV